MRWGGQLIGEIEQPCIAGFGREQRQRTDGYKTAVVVCGADLAIG